MSVLTGTVSQTIDISDSYLDRLYSVRDSPGQWSAKQGKAFFITSENEPGTAQKNFYLCAVNRTEMVWKTLVATLPTDWSVPVQNPVLFVDDDRSRVLVLYHDTSYSYQATLKTYGVADGVLQTDSLIVMPDGGGTGRPYHFSELVQAPSTYRERVAFLYGSSGGSPAVSTLAIACLNLVTLTLVWSYTLQNTGTPCTVSINPPAMDNDGNVYASWSTIPPTVGDVRNASYVAKITYAGALDTKQTISLAGSYLYEWMSAPIVWGDYIVTVDKLSSNWSMSSQVMIFNRTTFASTPVSIEFQNTNCWADPDMYGVTIDPHHYDVEFYIGSEYVPPPVILSDGTLFLVGCHNYRFVTPTTDEVYPVDPSWSTSFPMYLHHVGLITDSGAPGGYRPIAKGDILWRYDNMAFDIDEYYPVRIAITIDSEPLYVKGSYEDSDAVLYAKIIITHEDLDPDEYPEGSHYMGTPGMHFTVINPGTGEREETAEIGCYFHYHFSDYIEWTQSFRKNILQADLSLLWGIDSTDAKFWLGAQKTIWTTDHELISPVSFLISDDKKTIILSCVHDQVPYSDDFQPRVDTWTDESGSHENTYAHVFVGTSFIFDDDGAFVTDMAIPHDTFVDGFSGSILGVLDHTHPVYVWERDASPSGASAYLDPYYVQKCLQSHIPFSRPAVTDCGELIVTARLGYVYLYSNPNCCGVAVGDCVLINTRTGIITKSADVHVGDVVTINPRTGLMRRSCPTVAVGDQVTFDPRNGIIHKSR